MIDQDKFNVCMAEITNEFISATNNIISVYENFESKATINHKFGKILFLVYQVVMHDIFPSCQNLASKRHFISFIVITRSFYEVIIQLKWILSLEESKKQETINLFLEFEGVGVKAGRHEYEWHELIDIDPKFSYRTAAINLGLDSQQIPFNVSKFKLPEDKKNMSVYDFLSKVAHFNPGFLKEFVGNDEQGNLIFRIQYAISCIIGYITFVNCMVVFSDLFLTHFHGSNYIEKQAEIREIQEGFQKFIMSRYDTIINSFGV